MHPVDGLYPNHRKDFPGLDTIDYIEAMNPGVGRLYYSIVERFPKKQEVFTLVFLGFKKECVDMVIKPLYKETHKTLNQYSEKYGQPLEPIDINPHLKRIEDFITYITPKIDKNEDNYTTDIFKTVMTKTISEIIENHNTNGLPIGYVKKLVNSLLSTFTKKQLQN